MGKKRKNVPSLQDLLDRPICYYCERDFEDMSYLVDHMKAKHYKCGRCSRRLTTAGGLGVHMKQVHKEELTKIENAMKEREKPDVEVFGMEGFPPKLLESIKTRITNEFFKNEQKQRQETGNPPRGTQPVASNPQKQETIEEMKARLAAHKAQKAAEKAAAANGSGSGNNTPPVNNDAVAPPQDASMAQNYPKPGSITYDASGNKNLEIGSLDFNKSPMRGYDVTPVNPYAQPSNVMLPQSTYATPAMTMSSPMYPPSYTSMTSRGPNPATMASYPPRPSAGMSGSPPPSSFSYGASPPVTAARQNSLPSAPGLPQRPAFDSPNVSKEDMAKMHVGPGSTPPGLPMQYNGQMSAGSYAPVPPPNGMPYPQYGNLNAPYPGYPSNASPVPQVSDYVINTQGDPSLPGLVSQPPQNPIPTGDDIDALIRSVTGEQPESTHGVNTLPAGQPEFKGNNDSEAEPGTASDGCEWYEDERGRQYLLSDGGDRRYPPRGPKHRSRPKRKRESRASGDRCQEDIIEELEELRRRNAADGKRIDERIALARGNPDEADRILQEENKRIREQGEQANLYRHDSGSGGAKSPEVQIKQEPAIKQEPED